MYQFEVDVYVDGQKITTIIVQAKDEKLAMVEASKMFKFDVKKGRRHDESGS
jgi:hypothetical protein